MLLAVSNKGEPFDEGKGKQVLVNRENNHTKGDLV